MVDNDEGSTKNQVCGKSSIRKQIDNLVEKFNDDRGLETIEDACPRCGEQHTDNLLWDDNGEIVTCRNCGTSYTPGGGACQTFVLNRRWDDLDPVGNHCVLGRVKCIVNRSKEETLQRIQDFWEDFKDTEPDSDTNFMDWLIRTGEFVEAPVTDTEVDLE